MYQAYLQDLTATLRKMYEEYQIGLPVTPYLVQTIDWWVPLCFFPEKILDEATKIFEDVLEDFGSIKSITARFQQWKFGFPETYKQAFVHLCLPKLVLPFIKIELLDWNPLMVGLHVQISVS